MNYELISTAHACDENPLYRLDFPLAPDLWNEATKWSAGIRMWHQAGELSTDALIFRDRMIDFQRAGGGGGIDFIPAPNLTPHFCF